MTQLLPQRQAPQIAFQPHAFSSAMNIVQMPMGVSLGAMVRKLELRADYDPFLVVWFNGEEVPRAEWETTYIGEGDIAYVSVRPQGELLRTVAMIAIAVIAIEFAPYLAGEWGIFAGANTSLVAAGITLVGNALLNALIPPPKFEFDSGGIGPQKNQLTGSSNRFAPYAPIPRVLGKRRMYPMLAGRPYSEVQGDDEYLRMALLVGWGPLKISDIRIGDTPITSFDGVEYEVKEGWYGVAGHADDTPLTLYTRTISETTYSVLLSPNSGSPTYATRTTASGVTEITVDVAAPAGLCKFEDNGSRSSIAIDVDVQYSVAGANNWQTPTWLNSTDPGLDQNGRIRVEGKESSAIRRSGRFTVPTGQYDVRVGRTTSEFDTAKHIQEVRLTALRGAKPDYPVLQNGLCLIAIRMKASNQLNGVPQTINCIAESYLPVYNGSSWSYQITRNPAWCYTDILRRRANEVYLADDRLDLVGLKAWADACDVTAPNASEPRWAFNAVVEGGSVYQVLRQIAGSCRANYIVRDGKHSVVRDIQQSTPVQHITPRNSWNYSGTKTFIDYPHALRVRFTNADRDWQEDEVIVYDDGYSAGNATRFETLELPTVTSATQAWREGRYHIAVGRLRPEVHTVTMDIENVRCNIGDLVKFQHEAVSIGIAASRVKAFGGGGLVLDQAVPCDGTGSYAVRVRRADGTSVTGSVSNPGNGYFDTLSVSGLSGVQAGDLVLFGVSGSESVDMVITRIEPGPNFTATITMVDAQAGVYTADTGSIPAFTSNVTILSPIEGQRPDQMVIQALRSGDSTYLRLADGTIQDRIAVDLAPFSADVVRATDVEVQWRDMVAANWESITLPRGKPIFLAPVTAGATYYVRARAVTEYGVTGPWSTTASITVGSKTRAPTVVTGLGYVTSEAGITFTWTPSTDTDYAVTRIKQGATLNTASLVYAGTANNWTFVRPGTASYTFWFQNVDSLGNESTAVSQVVSYTQPAISNSSISLTSAGALQGGGGGTIDLGQLAGKILSTQFSTGIEPVSIVTGTLPASKTTSFIYRTNDGLLYRWNGSAYVADVPSTLITGQLSDSQLAAIAAAKITGTLVADQIGAGAVSVTKFASGIEPVTIVTGVPGTKSTNTIYDTTTGKLYRWNGSAYVASVPSTDISGTLADAQIAALAASKITGTLNDSQLAAIAAAKITGTLNANQLAVNIGGGNLVRNSNFKLTDGGSTRPLGWAVYNNANISYTANVVPGGLFGTNFFRLTASQNGNTEFGIYADTTHDGGNYGGVLDWAASQPYVISCWGRASSVGASGKPLTMLNRNGGFASITELSAPNLINGTWQRYAWRVTTPASGDSNTYGQLFISIVGSISSGSSFDVCAPQVEFGDYLTAYAPRPADILPGTITTTEISDNAITTPKLVAGAVVAGKIAANAISATEIQAGAITTAKLAAAAVTANEIAAGAIVAGKIAAGAVTATEIAAGTITGAKIAAGTIQAGNIAAGTITGNEIAANTITASQIAADTITAGQIAAGAISASELAAGAVTTAKLAAGAVTANEIAAGAIITNKLAAGAVTATELAAYAVTAGKIAASAVTATELAACAVTAGKIAANAVTATELAAGSVVAGKIAAGSIGTNELAANSVVTSKLLVTGRGMALNDDPSVQDATAWTLGGAGTWSIVSVTDGYIGASAIQATGVSGNGAHLFSRKFPVNPARKYRVRSAARRQNTAGTGVFYMRLYCYDGNGNQLAYDAGFESVTLSTSWQTFVSSSLTLPSGTVTASITVILGYNGGSGWHQVQDVRAEEFIEGDLIVDGSILAKHISVGSITADRIDSRNLSIKDASGNVIFSAGQNVDSARVNAASGWLNSNITVDGSGVLQGTGTSGVTVNNDKASIGGQNLLLNSSFDRWVTNRPYGWTKYDYGTPVGDFSLTQGLAGGVFGTSYVRMTANATISTQRFGICAGPTAYQSGIPEGGGVTWTADVDHVITFYARASSSAMNGRSVTPEFSNMTWASFQAITNPTLINGTWQAYAFRVKPTGANVARNELFISWDGAGGNLPVNAAWDICAIKVEQGRVPTAWAPAPAEVSNTRIALGANSLYNGDFSNGTDGWTFENYLLTVADSGVNFNGTYALAPLNQPGSGTIWIHQNGHNGGAGAYTRFLGKAVPVEVGKRYAISGYTGAHRCIVSLFAYYYNAAGTVIGWTPSWPTNDEEKAGGNLITDYKRLSQVFTVPATLSMVTGYDNAIPAYIRIGLQKSDTKSAYWDTGSDDSYLFACRLQVEQVSEGATEPGPWVTSGYTDQTAVRATNKITAANVGTYIASAAIGWAYIGDLNISTGGGIRSGKSTYGSGTGWLIEYNGGTPRLDIGSSTQYIRWSGSALEMKFNRIDLSATIPSGGSFPKNDGITRSLGSCTVTASGGTPPYTYSWSYTYEVAYLTNDVDNRGYATFSSNVAYLSARGDTDCSVTVSVACTVTDSNGLTATIGQSASGTFGNGPP